MKKVGNMNDLSFSVLNEPVSGVTAGFPAFCIRLLAMLVIALGLTACVTERIGGFNPSISQDEALDDYLQLARGYLETNEMANVRRHLANIAAIDPDNSEMFGIWGLVYAREGDLDLADESFKRSLRLDRNNSLTRNNYSAFLFSNGRYEEAYENLELVVKDTEYPGRAQAFENLGLTALRIGRQAEAINAFSRALQLNPNQVRSLTELLDIALADNDLDMAQGFYSNISTLQQFYQLPQTPRHLLQGITLAKALGNSGEATQLARVLATSFPNSLEYQIYQQSTANE